MKRLLHLLAHAALGCALAAGSAAAKGDRKDSREKEPPPAANTAPAADKNYLQQAREKYKDLNFQALPALLAEALLQPDLKREDYLAIYTLQGIGYTVLGDPQKAREAFIRLLAIDPNFEMDPKESPRFRNVFAEVKKEFTANSAVSVNHTAPTAGKPGESVPVELGVRDAFGRVNQVTARVRAVVCGKEGAFVDVPLSGAGTRDGERTFRGKLADPAASIPGDKPLGYFLEYQFTFSNQVGDPVDVSGGKPSYKLTLGDPQVATQPCAGAQASGASAEGGGGGGGIPVLPVLLGSAGAGLVVVVVMGVVAAGAAGATTAAVGLYCNANRAQCGLPKPAPNGRLKVTVDTGSPQ
jgi:hypothetical protein